MSGMAHGNAGIIAALAVLVETYQDEQSIRLLQQAWDFEDSLFEPAHQHWADLRNHIQASHSHQCASNTSWCYGAAGIGLSLWRIYHTSSSTDIKNKALRDMRRAVEVILANPAEDNLSLCHGEVGNTQYLLCAQSLFQEDRIQQRISSNRQNWIHAFHQEQIYCGHSTQAIEPSLMNGLSGIAYGLLNTHQPNSLPQVLALAGIPPQPVGIKTAQE